MRLTPEEKNAICSVVRSFCPAQALLYLYGSRADDTKSGGDIDLLLVVSSSNVEELVGNKIHHILATLKQAIGDQHIDFSVQTPEKAAKNPFFKMILKSAVELGRW